MRHIWRCEGPSQESPKDRKVQGPKSHPSERLTMVPYFIPSVDRGRGGCLATAFDLPLFSTLECTTCGKEKKPGYQPTPPENSLLQTIANERFWRYSVVHHSAESPFTTEFLRLSECRRQIAVSSQGGFALPG